MAILGQKAVTTAGTAYALSTADLGCGTWKLYPHPANSGTYMYLGYTSQTATSNTGVVLKKAVDEITITVVDLADVWVGSDTDGNSICYVQVENESVGKRAPVSW
ncbi:hypothetical protein [Candidatus Magnetobacterium casense]|uniref:Uncharacterized protein n=1 Tax=Candidatus Magnetobacterium casense TaxID=1455061 RepID=A0ABS6S4Z8_9BACT|nr:hypothetical protein [Candidatus Magnetobacterium casensis]MBV6343494.1 hypothetical protein [Candidatus Magnetobacterium casensis]